DSADVVCRRRPALGEACGNDAAVGHACVAGLVCTAPNNMASAAGTCVESISVGAGADCTSPATFCAVGSCTCTSDGCAEKRCLVPRLVGESCDDVNHCHQSLECVKIGRAHV